MADVDLHAQLGKLDAAIERARAAPWLERGPLIECAVRELRGALRVMADRISALEGNTNGEKNASDRNGAMPGL